ncbi:hypothetical protein [Kordia sp. SMS9]|uniref:hypothetical protein n=1 Tax=Kordia sp. SMS9 TaxID=2282170 RepID=UPI0013B37C92|nr:hypothetical protein [Kordia sp. SMS9]
MVVKGKVKVIKQVSTSKEGAFFQLKETFFFNRNGNIEKIEQGTQFQNDDGQSVDQVTTFKQLSDVERVGITMEKNSTDTIKIRKMKLVDSYTIKIDEKQVQDDRYITETIQKLDTLQRLKKIDVKIFEANSDAIEFEYSYEFVYEDNLVKEIISNNNGNKGVIKISDRKVDDRGNFTYRNHKTENGKIVYTEEREYEYYKD